MEFKKVKLNYEDVMIPINVDQDEIENNEIVFEDINTDVIDVIKIKEALNE